MKWKLVPVEPTPEMIDAWNNDDSDEFRHAYRAMLEAAPPTPSVPDADLVRDAERYRWLRAYNTAKHPAVTEAFFLGDENLDSAIDAAIAAEKGGAAFRTMIEKGQS